MNIQKQCQIFYCAYIAGYFDEVLLLIKEVYLQGGLFLIMIHTKVGLPKKCGCSHRSGPDNLQLKTLFWIRKMNVTVRSKKEECICDSTGKNFKTELI